MFIQSFTHCFHVDWCIL